MDTDVVVPPDQVRTVADGIDAREFEQTLYDVLGVARDDIDQDQLYSWAATGYEDGAATWGPEAAVTVTDSVPDSREGIPGSLHEMLVRVGMMTALITDPDGYTSTGDGPPHELHGGLGFAVYAFGTVADAGTAFDDYVDMHNDKIDEDGGRVLDPVSHPAVAEQHSITQVANVIYEDGPTITVDEAGTTVERGGVVLGRCRGLHVLASTVAAG